MKIVAILQNQWFKDPERIKRIIADTVEREAERDGGRDEHGVREYYIASFLFLGCLTGKRLAAAFGEDLCDEIVWEECSREIGGKSSSAFPPDPKHIRDVLDRHKPQVIVAFGKLAEQGLLLANYPGSALRVTAPHPAARGADVVPRLRDAAAAVRRFIEDQSVVAAEQTRLAATQKGGE